MKQILEPQSSAELHTAFHCLLQEGEFKSLGFDFTEQDWVQVIDEVVAAAASGKTSPCVSFIASKLISVLERRVKLDAILAQQTKHVRKLYRAGILK